MCDVGDAVSSIVSDVGSAASDVGTAVGSAASDVGSAIGTAASNVGDFVGNLFSSGGPGSSTAAAADSAAGNLGTAPAAIEATPLAPLGTGAAAAAVPAAAAGPVSAASFAGGLGDVGDTTGRLSEGSFGGPSEIANITGGSVAGNNAIVSAPPVAPPPETNSVINAIKNPSVSSIGSALLNNLGPIISGAGLLTAANKSTQDLPQQTPLVGQAQQLGTQGQQLLNNLNTGQLPPGADTALNLALHDEQARIRSQYASMGLSGSTMEAQALNDASQRAEAQKFNQIQQLVQTGLNETQLSSQIYQALQGAQVGQTKEFDDALSQFIAAMAGGGGSTQRIGR